MIPEKSALGLKLGRPANRTYTYEGDRRNILDRPSIMGPDAHGVYWEPVRAYYENSKTLVVFAPIHPDQLSQKTQEVLTQ